MINFSVGIDNQNLHDWHAKICDQKFSCPAPKESLLNLNATRALLKVVDCDEPSAIFRYDLKVSTYALCTQMSTLIQLLKSLYGIFQIKNLGNFRQKISDKLFGNLISQPRLTNHL